MAARVTTSVPFNGFVVWIATFSPTDESTFSYTRVYSPLVEIPRVLYASDFSYLHSNQDSRVIPAGTLSVELPDRALGSYTLKPALLDRDSYYLNAFRLPYDRQKVDARDGEPVGHLKVTLKAGESHVIKNKQALMVGVGTITVTRNGEVLSTQESPGIVDLQLASGEITIVATTDAVVCEIWV